MTLAASLKKVETLHDKYSPSADNFTEKANMLVAFKYIKQQCEEIRDRYTADLKKSGKHTNRLNVVYLYACDFVEKFQK